MHKLLFYCALPVVGFLCSSLLLNQPPVRIIEFSGQAQGTSFVVKYCASDTLVSRKQIDSLFYQLDASLSRYQSHSIISTFNRSQRGIVMDQHLHEVVHAALHYWSTTRGAFDITTLPLTELWNNRIRHHQRIPTDQEIQHTLSTVGSEWLQVKGDSLIKLKRDLRIDVDGIAQGYTVDCLVALLRSNLLTSFLIELGGEVFAQGTKPDGNPWTIGVARGSSSSSNYPDSYQFTLNGQAITTSGKWGKYQLVNGKAYGHIIDPKNGKPIENEMISTTVSAPSAMEADALDNAFMVMGLSSSLKWLEGKNEIGFFAVTRKNENEASDTCTPRFKQFIQYNEKGIQSR